jgi:hypothetical protein
MNSTIERTFCSGCGTFRFKEPEQLCYHCSRGAKVECPTAENSAVGQTGTVTFGGVIVDAPGFDQDRFERAICRALVDQLEVQYDATGEAIICHRGQNGGYRVTRHTCSCKAGEVGTPCKHRAIYCFHLDVREPAIRKQWASARKGVAA